MDLRRIAQEHHHISEWLQYLCNEVIGTPLEGQNKLLEKPSSKASLGFSRS
jgi:hypothetical protein